MIKTLNNIYFLRWLLVLAVVLFLLGIYQPMMTITTMVFFNNSFSILSGVGHLFEEGKYFLAVIIALFSIALPIVKMALLFVLLNAQGLGEKNHQAQPQLQRWLDMMHDYGRWAMLDVMVVAVLIVTVKLGAIASVKVHVGLYIFGAAVLLIMFITHQVQRLLQKQAVD